MAGEDGSGSPPCLLHELDGRGAWVDPQQARDVARWRKGERERLLAARQALDPATRTRMTAAIAADLDRLIPAGDRVVLSVYWPIRAEPDLRTWMKARSQSGTRIALPVATALGKPLVFREWTPHARMARGLWQIPYPAEGAEIVPTVVLAPLVGFDSHCYRLGYGGGFFDRTLAELAPRPRIIGVGYALGELPTIYPQPHDIPMDWIVTGERAPSRRP